MAVDLRGFATEIWRQLQEEKQQRAQRYRDLEAQQREIEAQQREIDEQLPSLQAALLRADKPIPKGCCPQCWIRDGEKIELTPIPSGDEDDLFRCHTCGTEFFVEP